MRPGALVRFTLVWLLVPVGLLAAQLFVSAEFPAGNGYPLAEQVRAHGSSVLVQPFTCLLACVVGARVRRSGLFGVVAVRRSRVVVLAQLLAVPVMGGTAVLGSTMATTSLMRAGVLTVDPRLLGMAALQSAAFAATGLALGLTLRAVIAAPVAVVLPYVLIGFPPALEPLWLRHLTWISSDCCSIHDDLSTRALTAQGAFLLALATGASAACVWAFGGPARFRAVAVGAVAAVSCVAVAVATALPLGVGAVDARPGAPVCAPVDTVQLCLWPEHEATRAQGEGALRTVLEAAARSGVAVPSTYTELEPTAVRWPTTSVDLVPGSSAASTLRVVASSLSPETHCRKRDGGDGAISVDAVPTVDPVAVLDAWWARTLAVPLDPGQPSPGVRTRLTRIRRLPAAQQARALNELVRAAAAVCAGTGR